MTSSMRVAAAQLAPAFLDRSACVKRVCETIREAGRNGAQLVAFPESFIPGYPYYAMVLDPTSIGTFLHTLFREAVEIPSPSTEALCAATRDAGVHAVVGVTERDGGTLYNGQLFIGPDGNILGKRRKLVPTAFERMVWGRGDGTDLRVFSTPLGVLGGLICYEHMNALFRYALQGQREQLHVAVWPGGMPSIIPMIDAAIRHYAFEAQACVVNVTSILTDEIIKALGAGGSVGKLSPGGGYSAILGPRGEFLAGPQREGETLLYADLEPGMIAHVKMIVDSAGHYARPDVVRLVLRQAPLLPLEIEPG